MKWASTGTSIRYRRARERERALLICLLTDFLDTSGLCRRNEEQHTYSTLGNHQRHMESIISSNQSYYPSESPAQVLWSYALESSSSHRPTHFNPFQRSTWPCRITIVSLCCMESCHIFHGLKGLPKHILTPLNLTQTLSLNPKLKTKL